METFETALESSEPVPLRQGGLEFKRTCVTIPQKLHEKDEIVFQIDKLLVR